MKTFYIAFTLVDHYGTQKCDTITADGFTRHNEDYNFYIDKTTTASYPRSTVLYIKELKPNSVPTGPLNV